MSMRACFQCGLDTRHLNTGVIQGKFGEYCSHCLSASRRSASSGYASYHREREREDNRRDILQPRLNNNKPNPEFIREYPEQSKKIFTKEELKGI